MVGLSIVLEGQKSINPSANYKKITPQVINKTTMTINKPPSPPSFSSSPFHKTSCNFLQQCFLCGQKLLPGKDIYMYKGDRGFCSVECRCRQIFMDEEESLRKDNCSFSAMKPTSSASSSSSSASSSSSSSPASASRHRKTSRNRSGGFAIY